MTPDRLRRAAGRRLEGARTLAAVVVGPGAGLRCTGDLASAEVALVSRSGPPLTNGYCLMLESLLAAVPPSQLALVTTSPPWPGRPHAQLASGGAFRLMPWGGTLLWDAAIATESRRAVPALARRMPRLRRILGGVDRYMGTAAALARARGADLWLYAIDDHTMEETPLIRRHRAAGLAAASRVFALSDEMGRHLQRAYGLRRYEVLPPLARMAAAPPPLPPGPRALTFVGNLFDYHRAGMEALARAARGRGGLVLRAVVPPGSLAWITWRPPPPWTVSEGRHNDVATELHQAHAGVILLDLDPRAHAGMSVAFPTKLRDYAAAGRPVLALVPRDSCVARLTAEHRLGWSCATVDDLARQACDLATLPASDFADAGQRAHAFAAAHLDLDRVGAAFVAEFVAAAP